MTTNVNSNNTTYIGEQYVSVAPQFSNENFAAFISRTANSDSNGQFIISDRDAFFKAGSYYNPMKFLSTVVTTSADIVEMPAFTPICSGWDSGDVKEDRGDSVSIKLYHAYAKFMVTRNMFSKINSCENYIKNVLSIKLASLEKKAIFFGGESGSEGKAPVGIINQIIKKYHTTNKEEYDKFSDKVKKFYGIKEISKIGGTSDLIKKYETELVGNIKIDELYKLKDMLNSAYYANATFIVSSSTFQKLIEHNNQQPNMLFNKLDTLYGHQVVIMDEVEDYVLLADFKQAVVIVEGQEYVIKAHSSYDRPNMIGISMPISMGVSILDYDAIVCAKLV